MILGVSVIPLSFLSSICSPVMCIFMPHMGNVCASDIYSYSLSIPFLYLSEGEGLFKNRIHCTFLEYCAVLCTSAVS